MPNDRAHSERNLSHLRHRAYLALTQLREVAGMDRVIPACYPGVTYSRNLGLQSNGPHRLYNIIRMVNGVQCNHRDPSFRNFAAFKITILRLL